MPGTGQNRRVSAAGWAYSLEPGPGAGHAANGFRPRSRLTLLCGQLTGPGVDAGRAATACAAADGRRAAPAGRPVARRSRWREGMSDSKGLP